MTNNQEKKSLEESIEQEIGMDSFKKDVFQSLYNSVQKMFEDYDVKQEEQDSINTLFWLSEKL